MHVVANSVAFYGAAKFYGPPIRTEDPNVWCARARLRMCIVDLETADGTKRARQAFV